MDYTTYEQLPLLLSIEQLMKVLGIGKNSAYNLVRSNAVKSIRIGHQIRIPKESLVSFIQA